jgi:glycosyltransferase involved in cell wall biosynthesis
LSLAVVIITKNEEKNILRCIESVDLYCDEIIVLDSFSADRTKEFCSGFSKVKFFQREFDDYIQQKNYANSLVKSEFILSLDADEYAVVSLQNFLSTGEYKSYDAVQFLRINYIGEYAVKFGLWKRDFKTRLWKRELGSWSGSIPHEHLELKANAQILNSTATINHHAYLSTDDLRAKAEKYALLAAKKYTTKPSVYLIWSIIVNPLFKFFKGYILLQGFRDGSIGWEIAKVSLLETFKKYFYALKLKFQNKM